MITRKSKGFLSAWGFGAAAPSGGGAWYNAGPAARGVPAGLSYSWSDSISEARIDESRDDLDGEWAADDLHVPGDPGTGARAAGDFGGAAGREGAGSAGQVQG